MTFCEILVCRLEVLPPESSEGVTLKENVMRIVVKTAPEHICIDKEQHRDLFLAAFVGIAFPAEEDPTDPEIYLVEIKHALLGIMEKNGLFSMAGVYWQARWHGHLLTDHIRIPRSCCVWEPNEP